MPSLLLPLRSPLSPPSSDQAAERGPDPGRSGDCCAEPLHACALQAVIDALPVGIEVQASDGRRLLINAAGSRALEGRAAAQRQPRPDEPQTYEHHLADTASTESRTLLVTSHRVRIADEPLLITTSVDISERKRLEQELAHRADHDPLTALPNRSLMQRLVDDAVARHDGSGGFALAFIDLDKFKRINDYYSHAVGDGLLRAVADRVNARIRPSDRLARISGDEFLLMVDPVTQVSDLETLIERIGDALREPFRIEGLDISTSASIGASLFPQHGRTYDELQRAADSAMYRTKREVKGYATLYSTAMGQAHGIRLAQEIRLRAAVNDQRFLAALQPKVDLRDGRVVGFEALARWVETDGRVHGPESFIEMASEMGLLDEIAEQVAGDVLDRLAVLQARFGPQTTVSLNVSARQAGDNRFMHRLTQRLDRNRSGRSIVLEVTEDALLATQHFQQDILPMLREAGIRVSIDDFGTGYSSLAMLADLAVDEIKIDRAFISGIHERPRSQGILKAIESLCATLGIAMVAEGVELGAELDYLRRQTRIGMAQGYCFDRAAIISEVLRNPVCYRLDAARATEKERVTD